MSKKNILLIMIFAILILLVYSVDLFKLNYRLAGWEEFGDAPVNISHIQYFVTDTPNIISCLDRSIGEDVACYEAAAFVKTDAEEIYRCCDAGEKYPVSRVIFPAISHPSTSSVSLSCGVFLACRILLRVQGDINSMGNVSAAGLRS